MGVTLKLATSLDGRIATAGGESRWITGDAARRAVHQLRSEHDAVLVGIGTALADDPELTVRLDGFTGAQPARVVIDSHQRLPLHGKLAQTARDIPTVVVTTDSPSGALRDVGVKVLQVAADGEGRTDLGAAMSALAGIGLSGLFVEGGGRLAAGFLQAGLVDRLEWFRAPLLIGEEGRSGVGPLSLGELAAALRFTRISAEAVGEDLWERYERL